MYVGGAIPGAACCAPTKRVVGTTFDWRCPARHRPLERPVRRWIDGPVPLPRSLDGLTATLIDVRSKPNIHRNDDRKLEPGIQGHDAVDISSMERNGWFHGALAERTLHSETAFQLVEDGDLFKHVRIVDANDNIVRFDGRE